MKSILLKLLLALSLLSALFVFLFFRPGPSLQTYETYFERPVSSAKQNSRLPKVTFLGVTTLLFDDGETAFMTDGFFTRPNRWKVFFGKVAPDEAVISAALEKAGVRKLAAVIPVHSHYDHALDSPAVAKLMGAELLGSESTANIGRGYGLPEKQIRVVKVREKIQLGKFHITFFSSEHSPDAFYEGIVREPLPAPARASDYKMGNCYSLLVEHGGQRILVHGSAGFIPGALRDLRADVVYLGVGALGMQSREYMRQYWNEIVSSVHAKKVILIHWDDFFRSLSEPLRALPWPGDRFQETMAFMVEQGKKEGVGVLLPVLNEPLEGFHR